MTLPATADATPRFRQMPDRSPERLAEALDSLQNVFPVRRGATQHQHVCLRQLLTFLHEAAGFKAAVDGPTLQAGRRETHLCAKADALTKPSPAGPKPLPGVVTMSHFCRICAQTSAAYFSPTGNDNVRAGLTPLHHHMREQSLHGCAC